MITTPPISHYELAKEALLNGKNVLVEKPFTETVAQAKELFELAASKKLMIQCFQNRRFDSDFLTVKKIIDSGILGDLLEIEMHYDYFRPEVPEEKNTYSKLESFVYTHACHTVDQVLSYFGEPTNIHYDVKQILGTGRMSDYFDIDMCYDHQVKVSIKSSYFRLKERPSFVVYGTKGCFVKATKDRQEEHLKHFYMPTNADFGIDLPEHYGVLSYIDEEGTYHEEKVVSEVGDYSMFYQHLYDTLKNNKPHLVTEEETIKQIEILNTATSRLSSEIKV
ncbi:putative dehydrogenase [Vagococcus fluvialis]|nr:putative dehydrogenase [Vagococcus fluvialis]